MKPVVSAHASRGATRRDAHYASEFGPAPGEG